MRKPPAPAFSTVYDRLFPEDRLGTYIVAAIIEPALWPELGELLQYHSPEWYILFDKRPTDELIQVLPRIVRLEPNAVFTGLVLAQYGKRRNIYLRAEVNKNRPDLCDLVLTLKTFANVKLPGNQWSWLRYYDPVVFCHLMQVATGSQRKALFGPHISSFFAESVWDGEVKEFTSPDSDYQPQIPVVFSPDQKEKFDDLYFIRFKLELTGHLLDSYFPKITAEKQVTAVTEAIHKAVDLALEYGAVQKKQCLEFVTLGAQHGFDCYSAEPIANILAARGHLDEKIEQIKSILRNQAPNDIFRGRTDAI